MRKRSALYLSVAAIAIAAVLAGAPAQLNAQQAAAVNIGNTDLGGVVSGPNGPEAGVWVIAETTDLPTKMAKIVVTDDQGRYVMPDLPKANYSVWVRGYGLVDSPKVQTAPGKILNLTAVLAPNAAAAAEYYPADLLVFDAQGSGQERVPRHRPQRQRHHDDDQEPGPVPATTFKTDGCFHCHQLGNKATRTIPEELGQFKSRLRGVDAAHPVRPGQRGHGRDHRAVSAPSAA